MRHDKPRDELTQLVELAAYLTMTATTDDTRQVAAPKRAEAQQAIAEARSKLDELELLLGCFPAAYHC